MVDNKFLILGHVLKPVVLLEPRSSIPIRFLFLSSVFFAAFCRLRKVAGIPSLIAKFTLGNMIYTPQAVIMRKVNLLPTLSGQTLFMRQLIADPTKRVIFFSDFLGADLAMEIVVIFVEW